MDYKLPEVHPPEDYLEKTAAEFMVEHRPGTPEWGLAVGYLHLLRDARDSKEEVKKPTHENSVANLFSDNHPSPFAVHLNKCIKFNHNKPSDVRGYVVEINYLKSGARESEPRRIVPYGAVNDMNISGFDLDREALRSFKLDGIGSVRDI